MRKQLYIKLKELREKNNLSQTKVAESLGVSRQAISQWETGKSYPDIDNIALLCNLYKISMDELMEVNLQNELEKELQEEEKSVLHNEKRTGKIVLDNKQQYVLEMIGLAVILVMACQFAFLGILATIFIDVWMRWTKRDYRIIYILSVICMLISINNAYIMIEHWIFNLGIAGIIRM